MRPCYPDDDVVVCHVTRYTLHVTPDCGDCLIHATCQQRTIGSILSPHRVIARTRHNYNYNYNYNYEVWG